MYNAPLTRYSTKRRFSHAVKSPSIKMLSLSRASIVAQRAFCAARCFSAAAADKYCPFSAPSRVLGSMLSSSVVVQVVTLPPSRPLSWD